MIGFEENDSIFTEGIIEDSIKDATNVDIDKIKKDWGQKIGNATDAANKIAGFNAIAVDDVLDPVKKKIDEKNASKNFINRGSIIARSRNSVMQFPVYVTQTIRVNEAHIISKLFERVYASLFQTILAQNPIIDQDEANNLVFLKRFHTNINESADLILYNEFYSPIDDLDEMLKESVFYKEQVTPTMAIRFRRIPCVDQYLVKECARLATDPLEGLDYLKEDGQNSQNIDKWRNLTDDEIRAIAIDNLTVKDAKTGDIRKAKQNEIKLIEMSDKDAKNLSNKEQKDRANLLAKVDEIEYKLKEKIKNNEYKTVYKYKDGKYYSKIDAINAPKVPILLKDTDVKKINGMLPYTIEAAFIMQDKDGNAVKEVKFIIGIKTILHVIRPQDLSEDVKELVTGNIKSLQKVRYKTGEITFMDYLFNTKGIKNDAAKSVNYNKKWINTLKRLGEWEKINGSLLKTPAEFIRGGDIPIPNGTLILSKTDVNIITNQTGIDLSVVSNAKRLARSLFLIGICIVDSSAGKMSVLFPDSSSEWDVQSLASIDADLAKSDNSQVMRELNRMVNH